MNQQSTQNQRFTIRCELLSQELPVDQITLMHRRAFEHAGIAMPEQGKDVDAVLCDLSRLEASRLLDALRVTRGSRWA